MGFDLDPRQRAMLEEMHLRVWWPEPSTRPAHAQALEPAMAETPPEQPRAAPIAPPAPPALPARVREVEPPVQARERDSAPRPASPLWASVQEMDWPAVEQSVAGCSACGLCTGRRKAVFLPEPQARQVDWMVVGEPPDESEERAGTPFAGPAGVLLDNMLRAVGVARGGTGAAGARLTPVVKCRTAPPRNPQPDEVATCVAYLRREIALARPKVILAAGRFAAQALLSPGHPEAAGQPFGKLRGRVYRFEGVPVVLTYPPARLLRAPEDKAQAWADLCLALSVARGST